MEDRSLFDAAGDESSLDQLDAGFELLLAAEVVGDALEAVDVDALRAGAPIEQAVGDDADGLAGTVVREAAGLAGAKAVTVAVDGLEYTSS